MQVIGRSARIARHHKRHGSAEINLTSMIDMMTILVFFLLVIIYRSPIFWALPLFAVILAESVVRGLGYVLASNGVVINGQVGGILLVLLPIVPLLPRRLAPKAAAANDERQAAASRALASPSSDGVGSAPVGSAPRSL